MRGAALDMALAPVPPEKHEELLAVLALYLRLLGDADPDMGLGGKLFFCGPIDTPGRRLIQAANIAGAASLAATDDIALQKEIIRNGIVDFVVTSLDEALRILKNEIRKRAPVAVCIAAAPHEIEMQMAERGVAPDLLRPASPLDGPESAQPKTASTLVVWSVASAPARWMPKVDAMALDCLPPEAGSARRWLRMAPRYLGRLAQGTHLVSADRAFAARLIDRLRESQPFEVPLEIQVSWPGGAEQFHFGAPPMP